MASGGRRGGLGVEKKLEERLPLLEKIYQVRASLELVFLVS